MNRRLLFLILFIGFLAGSVKVTYAQVTIKNYDPQWKRVEAFVNKELPQSALAEVKKIYALAKKENQAAQVIKSLLWMMQLQHQTRENNIALSITEIETEIKTAREPARSILQSMLAGMYWNYFQQNRWKLYDRSRTVNFVQSDIATWSAEDLHKKISALYLQSIAQESVLQATRLAPYDAIIEKGNMRHLRPTLYDLLAFQALDYFTTDEHSIHKPAYAFEIKEKSAFAPAAQFAITRVATRDTLSLKHKAMLLYAKLLAFHLKDAKPDALIDADLHRLEFVHQHSTHPDKDQLFYDALAAIGNKYKDLPAASQAWYLMAQYLHNRAENYQPYGDTANRFDRVKAKEILDRIVAQKDSSEGKMNALQLLQAITARNLQFQVEKVNVPGQPFRSFVEYRNINRLYLRVITMTDEIRNMTPRMHEPAFWTMLADAKTMKTWEQSIPATQDYQQHRVEIPIEPLPRGEYLLVASTAKDFSDPTVVVGARIFHVSNISFVNNERDYFILHREKGNPLANASVQVWNYRYDYSLSMYTKTKSKSYRADNNGFFRFERDPAQDRYGSYNYLLEIEHEGDRLFLNDPIYDYYYYRDNEDRDPKATDQVYLFTDRKLYRPGQDVFFKGIVFTRMPEVSQSRVNDNYETTVYLRDANYQVRDSIKVNTNAYGSFQGKFRLPASGLTGQFTLFTKKDPVNAFIQMEEYKRPKFFVEFEPIKETYKLNDEITITGTAKAYAGNNIDGANVRYRVVRKPRFIYPWISWRWWLPPAPPMEITQGEVKTDAQGKFTITFKAIPDEKIERKLEPVFDYEVIADVTDINGETRTGDQTVSVGYKSLLLVTQVPERISTDSLKSLNIFTRNMNGEHQRASLTVQFTSLVPEKRLIRDRYWERPDQFVLSKTDYIALFPHDEYNNESDPATWQKNEIAFRRIDTSTASGKWSLSNAIIPPGYYVLEIETRDREGNPVKDIKYIEVFKEDVLPAAPKYIWTANEKVFVKPGEVATVTVGSSAENVHLVKQEVRNAGKDAQYERDQLSASEKDYRFPVTEKDRGGYGVSWMFVKHNRVFTVNRVIAVPWDNKGLKVEYASFRDKLLPGASETWKIRISGHNNEKVAAEMLATMYDASLDQFYPHGLTTPNLWPAYFSNRTWRSDPNFEAVLSQQRYIMDDAVDAEMIKTYDRFIFSPGQGYDLYAANMKVARSEGAHPVTTDEVTVQAKGQDKAQEDSAANDADGESGNQDNKTAEQGSEVQVRRNFNETAFFLPQLTTDETGAIEFSFTIPEALTRWKFMGLAHTKDGAFVNTVKEIVTQKELMVQPNMPRFVREGDRMEFNTKIVNLSEKELTGQVYLQLFDANTNQPVDGWFKNSIPNQYFTVAAGQSDVVKFPMEVPFQYNRALVWRVVAKAENFSDGEENAMPVLTNRMLVTESLPLTVRGGGTKTFDFTKLLQSGSSETLQHHGLTIEYTSNPVWYAVQSLPYLMEYPYECAEQNWNRYYANALATHIVNKAPRIKEVFERWRITDTAALMSNLQKNQELKAVLLEETPWVLQAKSEAEQKRNIALLFDMVRMSRELDNSYEKLKQMQSSNGGFVWFKGGPDDRYMTQYIVTGIGHLMKLGAVPAGQQSKLDAILQTAIPYLDRKIKEDYDHLVKNKVKLDQRNIGYSQIQYLYMRSFFPKYKVPETSATAWNYYFRQAVAHWTGHNKYMQGMIALALHRANEKKTATDIMASLKETSISHPELGMYWMDRQGSGPMPRFGWFWHEAPIERQALLIEAFSEVSNNLQTVDDLRTWLLRNKQTNHWSSTKATAEACYALLLTGSGSTELQVKEIPVTITVGSTTVSNTGSKSPEAGTGYFKEVIAGDNVKPEMGKVTVNVQNGTSTPSTSWGAVYWQYFEDLDKITTAETPLKLSKKLFIEKNTDRGPVLTPVQDGGIIRVGDRVRVRIELRVDRDMEYVHMKDLRASTMEPLNVLSGYRWQGGLGYYESTRDASTNFFFNYLGKGTYVFEYTMFATHTGNFSNGVTTIQCMYAPEYMAHSEGIRVNVE